MRASLRGKKKEIILMTERQAQLPRYDGQLRWRVNAG